MKFIISLFPLIVSLIVAFTNDSLGDFIWHFTSILLTFITVAVWCIHYTKDKQKKAEDEQKSHDSEPDNAQQIIETENQQDEPISDIDRIKLKVEENANDTIGYIIEKTNQLFFFESVIPIGELRSGEYYKIYYYLLVINSNSLGKYGILFTSTENNEDSRYLNWFERNVSHTINEFLLTLQSYTPNLHFPIMPFNFDLYNEAIIKLGKDVFSKQEIKYFSFYEGYVNLVQSIEQKHSESENDDSIFYQDLKDVVEGKN